MADKTTRTFHEKLVHAIHHYQDNICDLLQTVTAVDLGLIVAGETILHFLLACEPKLHYIEAILKKNDNKKIYSVKSKYGYTPFQAAILFCTLPVAKLLLQYASWEVCTSSLDNDFTAAYFSDLNYFKQHFSNDDALLQLLKKRDESSNTSVTFYLLCNETNDLSLLKWIVDRIKAIENISVQTELYKQLNTSFCETKNKFNPLLCASCKGNLDAIKFVITEGLTTTINKPNSEGHTMLLQATMKGHEELVKWLINSNTSSITERSADARSALLIAASQGHFTLCKWLVSHGGSNIDEQTIHGDTVLHASVNYFNIFHWFVEQGADINRKNELGLTPFLLAATGSLQTFNWLINTNQVNINDSCNNKCSAIIIAAAFGSLDVIKVLLQNGANVNDSDSQQHTALMTAAQGCHAHIVEYLIEQGADVTLVDWQKRTALFIAAQEGYLAIVKLLCTKRKESINIQANFGLTPLLIACQNSHNSVAKYLAKVGGPSVLQATDDNNNNALDIALTIKNDAMVKYFYRKGLQCKAYASGATFLQIACYSGSAKLVKWILKETNADITAKDYKGRNCLHYAAMSGSVTVFEYLLSKCPRTRTSINDIAEGHTVLTYACAYGKLKLMKWLLDGGYCSIQNSALHEDILCFVASTANAKILQFLVEKGANINATDANGNTPLLVAIKHGQTKQVETLLRLGANPTKSNYSSYTPLLLAAKCGQLSVMKLLMQYNAPLTEHSPTNNSALHFAASAGHVNVVDWLLEGRREQMYTSNCEQHDCFLVAFSSNKYDVLWYLLLKRFYMVNHYHTMFEHSIVIQSAITVRAVVYAVAACKMTVQTLLVILTSERNRLKCCHWLPNELVTMVLNSLWQIQLVASENNITCKLMENNNNFNLLLSIKTITMQSAEPLLNNLHAFCNEAKANHDDSDENGNNDDSNTTIIVSRKEVADWLFSATKSVEFAFAQAKLHDFRQALLQLSTILSPKRHLTLDSLYDF